MLAVSPEKCGRIKELLDEQSMRLVASSRRKTKVSSSNEKNKRFLALVTAQIFR